MNNNNNNKLHSNNNNNENKNIDPDISYWKLSNLCRLIFFLLLLLLLQQQQNYILNTCYCVIFVVATATKLHIKNNKNKKIKFTYIFCSIINNSIEEADYKQTYLCQMYPPVKAYGDQEWYYIRSA